MVTEPDRVSPGPLVAARRTATRSALAEPRRVELVAFALGVAVTGAVRVWQIGGRGPLGWNDTADFVAGSRAPWLSVELWAGQRSVGTPLALKLVGGDLDAYVVWQAVLATACWAALAASVATVVVGPGARWLAVTTVLAFSATAPVTMWERSVLSESLAISLLALVVAAGVQMARGVTGWRVAGLLVALAPWLATRDSHAAVALVGGTAAAAAVAASWLRSSVRRRRTARDGGGSGDATGWWDAVGSGDATGSWDGVDSGGGSGDDPAQRRWRRPLAALALGALVLGLLVGLGSSHGERHAFPMRNVYEVRVLPYPDRVRWFADHGMPQAEVFLGPDARAPYVEPGLPPVVSVGDDDAQLGPWLDWVGSDGRAAFARFVATHPLYLVTEPLRSPERSFNNARGDRRFYTPPDLPRVPLVDRFFALPTSVVLLVAAGVGGWAFGRWRWTPVLAVGMVTAALAVPHGLFAWHSDGMETARHLVVPALQLHLGVLLLVIGALPGAAGRHAGSDASPAPRADTDAD